MQRRGYSVFKAVELILRSILRKNSKEEQEEYNRMLEETDLLKQIDRLSGPKRIREALEEDRDFDTAEAYRKFLICISDRSSRNVFLYVRVAAAWLLLLIAGGLAWYLVAGRESGQVPTEEIKPVGVNAFLTFADGSRIRLTNDRKDIPEKDGVLVMQDSGCLVYSQTKESREEILFNRLTIPRGGEYVLKLADGTKVWLNSDSELKYPVRFTGNKREVFLKGEGYFAVSRDVEKPFIVHTSLGKVEVLGTEFNVRDYAIEKRVVTTLAQGKVKYSDPRHTSREVELIPGFQVIDYGGESNLKAEKVSLAEFIGWKDGLYIFNDLTLEEMMQTIERNYNVTVFFTSEAIKHLRFSGDLKKYDRVEHFLRFIETGGDVTFHIKGKTITVQPK